ncbi:MAG: hypothetical protein F6K10_31320 [Moorea sp. SIO2B7]|nr:hypothetical protein [Moorena sp. SIO2B7]
MAHAEDVWQSKSRITDLSKSVIWDKVGELSGCDVRILERGKKCKSEVLNQVKSSWDDIDKKVKRMWFVDEKKKEARNSTNMFEKDKLIKSLQTHLEEQDKVINETLTVSLALIYQELASIQSETSQDYINRLDKQSQEKLLLQINSIVGQIEAKFSKPTEELPNNLNGFSETARNIGTKEC